MKNKSFSSHQKLKTSPPLFFESSVVGDNMLIGASKDNNKVKESWKKLKKKKGLKKESLINQQTFDHVLLLAYFWIEIKPIICFIIIS